jgi:hypothetical protein
MFSEKYIIGEPVHNPTLYTLVLACLLKCFVGINYVPKELIVYNGVSNSIFGGLTCIFVYYSMMYASGKNKALSFFSSLVVAIYPGYLLWNAYVLKDTINIFMMSMGIFSIYRVLYSENYKKVILNLFLFIIVLILNTAFRKANGIILFGVFSFIIVIVLYNWLRRRFYKKTTFIAILLLIFIPLFLVSSHYELEWSGSFQSLYSMNSPGGPFETWGYYESRGERTPAWRFLGIDHERYNNSSYTKKELLSIYALFKYAITDPIQFLTHLSEKFINMWRPVWRNSSIKTHLMMEVPYLAVIVFFILYFFRKKKYNFQVNILPFLALAIVGATIHLLWVGQIRFRIPIMLGVLSIAGICLYDFMTSFLIQRSKKT